MNTSEVDSTYILRYPRRLPLIVICLALFIFFSPMRTLEISGDVFGFSVNPGRFFILIATALLACNIAMNPRYLFHDFHIKITKNPYVVALLVYFFFSLLYYYVRVFEGENFLFGNNNSFFLSWRGRPIAQFISFFTYGVVPFYLTFRFSLIQRTAIVLERALVNAALLLTFYGFVQQIAYFFFKTGITPQNFSNWIFPDINVLDINLLRFYSLGGEPRDFSSFILGAVLFYAYVRFPFLKHRVWIAIVLMVLAFILTFSTTGYFIFFIALTAIIVDAVYRGSIRIRFRHIRFIVLLFLVLAIFFYKNILTDILRRPLGHYDAFVKNIGKQYEGTSEISTQSMDLAVFYYIIDLPISQPHLVLFGYGYGNFLTPIAPLMLHYFGFGVLDSFRDTRSFLAKIFVEGGVVGVMLYLLIFFRALRTHRTVLRFLHASGDRTAYTKALLFRLSFIVFFVSGAFQISYYYLILLGIMMAQVTKIRATATKVPQA